MIFGKLSHVVFAGVECDGPGMNLPKGATKASFIRNVPVHSNIRLLALENSRCILHSSSASPLSDRSWISTICKTFRSKVRSNKQDISRLEGSTSFGFRQNKGLPFWNKFFREQVKLLQMSCIRATTRKVHQHSSDDTTIIRHWIPLSSKGASSFPDPRNTILFRELVHIQYNFPFEFFFLVFGCSSLSPDSFWICLVPPKVEEDSLASFITTIGRNMRDPIL
mmetsp:Transcript_45608/g.110492  ORF Transcript_45608/g.110492 Transcript_45608/m.110492 type:complete len:223 (+) Transcript_45608:1441-2109(+)